jgi:pyrroline-5-carboxylate reductase
MKDTAIAVIGCGNMGRSLLGGLIADGHPQEKLRAADPNADQRERAARLFGIDIFANNADAIRDADVVVLAVKPHHVRDTVSGCAEALLRQRPLLVSIAAGVRLAAIRKWLGADLPVVRAMPNTPALVSAGASGLFANDQVRPHQRELAEAVLRAVGVVLWLEEESLLDVVTAVSGSGPAYFFLLMEALEDAGTDLGLTREQARLLVLETAFGSAKMALEGESAPRELRRQVTSPGGTTEKAVATLEQADFSGLLARAVAAARRRSTELADTYGES